MFRYMLWRLRFELCNLKRLLGPGERRVEYLAFGANLSDAILRERRIKPLAARPFTHHQEAAALDPAAGPPGQRHRTLSFSAHSSEW